MFDIGSPNRVASKFPMFGDFEADLVFGNSEERALLLRRIRGRRRGQRFFPSGEKATREWGRRFEHGFSQLVDWFYLLDDMKNTQRRAQDFGYGETRFHGLLVIGGPPASATTNAIGSFGGQPGPRELPQDRLPHVRRSLSCHASANRTVLRCLRDVVAQPGTRGWTDTGCICPGRALRN